MIEVPLNANVECLDGHVGRSTHVVFDPATRRVTHVVVKDERDADAQDRLVPVEKIAETTRYTILLDCGKEELAGMAPFSEVRYLSYVYEDYSTLQAAVTGLDVVPSVRSGFTREVDEHIPETLGALRHGASVEALDGAVGEVGELIVDPDTGQLTHFSLQEGHWWGRQEVILPLTAVREVTETVVRLKLDREQIAQLPATPIKRRFEEAGQLGGLELFAKFFDRVDQADEALKFLKTLQRDQRGAMKVLNAAVVVKEVDGRTSLRETGELTPTKGSILGAIGGGLIGLLAGPVGAVIGVVAGAGIGTVASQFVDLGFPNEFLERLQDSLRPGSSALMVLVEHEYVDQLSDALNQWGGGVMRYTLTDAVVKDLLRGGSGVVDSSSVTRDW